VSLSPFRSRVFSPLVAFVTSTYFAPPNNTPKKPVSSQNQGGEETGPLSETDPTHSQKPPVEEVESEKMQTVATEEIVAGETLTDKTDFASDEPADKPIEEKILLEEKDKESYETTVIVKEGDTLTGLAMTVYGRINENILNLVHRHNPDIKNMNWIDIGQKIVFPKLQEPTTKGTFTVHIASYKLYEPALSMYRDLLENGYEVYILPKEDPQKGKIFRVIMGFFKSQEEAEDYAETVLKQGISEYASPIQLHMK
jgi:phage tail protein X